MVCRLYFILNLQDSFVKLWSFAQPDWLHSAGVCQLFYSKSTPAGSRTVPPAPDSADSSVVPAASPDSHTRPSPSLSFSLCLFNRNPSWWHCSSRARQTERAVDCHSDQAKKRIHHNILSFGETFVPPSKSHKVRYWMLLMLLLSFQPKTMIASSPLIVFCSYHYGKEERNSEAE